MTEENALLAWLSPSGQTLAWDTATPWLAAGLAIVWLLSLRLIPFGRDWRRIPMSLFGWAWAWFGMLFVLRFWVLSLDALTYGEPGGRLLRFGAPLVDEALLLAGTYWVAMCFGYFVARLPRLGVLGVVGRTFAEPPVAALDAVASVAAVAVFVGNSEAVPAGLLTPLGLVGRLWLCPAAVAWGTTLGRDRRPRPLRVRRWLYLLPGVLQFYFQPYREALLAVAIVPLLAAIMAGRRVRMGRVVLLLLAFALLTTPVVAVYRAVKWEGRPASAAIADVDPSLWVAAPWATPWANFLRRFHGLDSLLLYVELVPDLVPFDQTNPLVSAALGAFVPRALYPEKPGMSFAFSRELWTYGSENPFEAAIAPSMAGSLYGTGGPHWIVVGALVWGALLGFVDRWAMRLPPISRLVPLAALCLIVGGGIERDFGRATATLLQNLLALTVLGLLLPGRIRTQRFKRRDLPAGGSASQRRAARYP